ncbi:MAG: hypothetical protein JJ863_00325 [Deltaproteobacteria bacterium]|nr:hypothetical protein [Deltaproteobacteria bacterium]
MQLSVLSLGHETVRFFERYRTFAEGWAACERPDWMIELALHAQIDRRRLVVLTTPVVERALERHGIYVDTLSIARHWARGNVDGAAAWAAGFRASERAKESLGPPASALRAAGALAFACDATSSPTYYAVRAHLVDAVALAMQSIPDEAVAHAETIRRGLPIDAVETGLRARVAESQPPSRASGEQPRQPHSWWPPIASGDDD